MFLRHDGKGGGFNVTVHTYYNKNAYKRENRLFLQGMRQRVTEMVWEMPCLRRMEHLRGRDRRHGKRQQIGEEKRRIGDGQRFAYTY